MTRDEIVKLKALAFDRMRLCHAVFIGNKPPHQEHAFELLAHASFYSALVAELGEPLSSGFKSEQKELLYEALASLKEILSHDPGTQPANATYKTIKAVQGILVQLLRTEKGGCS